MKKIIVALFLALMFAGTLLIVAFAHSGKTDSYGGHYDHSTGKYHYHHGYSAHDHYDMDGDGDADCPYDFKDKTNHNSGNSSSSNNKKTDSTTSNQDRLDALFEETSSTIEQELVSQQNKMTIGEIIENVFLFVMLLIISFIVTLDLLGAIYSILGFIIRVLANYVFNEDNQVMCVIWVIVSCVLAILISITCMFKIK